MKKGDKYINRKTRHVVTIEETYISQGKKVVRYGHYRAPGQIGARFISDFKEKYRPKPMASIK